MSGYAPLIGITVEGTHEPENPRSGGSLKLSWNYAQVISDLGGVPILIPPTADPARIADLIDGLLIPGGLDIDASRFDQENHPKAELQDPSRFASEIGIFQRLSPSVPVLGICYGCQFINVAQGGSLIQHIPDVTADESHSGGTLQDYGVSDDSKLASIFQATQVQGKSFHHQSVDRVGEGLRVVAKADDGIIEALESTDRPWMIGVQWHPERTAEDSASQNLFRDFIAAAKAYGTSRR